MLLEVSDWAFCTRYDLQLFEKNLSPYSRFNLKKLVSAKALLEYPVSFPHISRANLSPPSPLISSKASFLLTKNGDNRLFFLGGISSFTPAWWIRLLASFCVVSSISYNCIDRLRKIIYDFWPYCGVGLMTICDLKMDNFLSFFINSDMQFNLFSSSWGFMHFYLPFSFSTDFDFCRIDQHHFRSFVRKLGQKSFQIGRSFADKRIAMQKKCQLGYVRAEYDFLIFLVC